MSERVDLEKLKALRAAAAAALRNPRISEGECAAAGRAWDSALYASTIPLIAELEQARAETLSHADTAAKWEFLSGAQDEAVQALRAENARLTASNAALMAHVERLRTTLQSVFDFYMAPAACGDFRCDCGKPELCGICEICKSTREVLAATPEQSLEVLRAEAGRSRAADILDQIADANSIPHQMQHLWSAHVIATLRDQAAALRNKALWADEIEPGNENHPQRQIAAVLAPVEVVESKIMIGYLCGACGYPINQLSICSGGCEYSNAGKKRPSVIVRRYRVSTLRVLLSEEVR